VFYDFADEEIQIVGVMHTSRQPDDWLARRKLPCDARRVAEFDNLSQRDHRGDRVMPTDYEVLGLASDGRHFFFILLFGHVMT
jgi:hypothetical protein